MIERIDDMPEGTIGLRGAGKLDKSDYVDVLEPALQEAVAAGDMRLLFELTDFDGLEHGAWIEDVKTGLRSLVKDHDAWHRFALVTDIDWVAKGTRAFAWLTPGEVRVFGLGDLEAAKEWVSA